MQKLQMFLLLIGFFLIWGYYPTLARARGTAALGLGTSRAGAITRHSASRLGPPGPGGYTTRTAAHSHAHSFKRRTHTQPPAGEGETNQEGIR